MRILPLLKGAAFTFAHARSTALTCSGRVRKMSMSATTSSVDVVLVPMFTDNYGYIVIDKASKLGAIVDPGDAPPVIEAVKQLEKEGKMKLAQLWCTHKHGDHTGGNDACKAAFPDLQVIGTQYEHVPSLTQGVGEGSAFKLGESSVKVFHVPCHTSGHVAFIVGSEDTPTPVLFPGDTLFVGGCGRFFEGTGADMLKNMDRLTQLPPSTLVYPAHEYTESNLKFLASVDPEQCVSVYKDVQATRSRGQPTVPSTIGHELSYNLFMQTREERVQALVGAAFVSSAAGGGSGAGAEAEAVAVATMNALREMKNKF